MKTYSKMCHLKIFDPALFPVLNLDKRIVIEIRFISGVSMRNKKSKSDEVPNDRIERPMSWEGELSDSEMKQVSILVQSSTIVSLYFDNKSKSMEY